MIRSIRSTSALLAAVFTGSLLLGAGTTWAGPNTETPREMECKDVASEGDELSTPPAFAECERLYGSPVTKFRWARHHMPACKTEDSTGPCFWNAKLRGNGKGHSFWVDGDNAVHYRTAKLQRRLG